MISLRQRREADRQQMSAVACYLRGLTLILQHARPSLAPGAFPHAPPAPGQRLFRSKPNGVEHRHE